MALPPEIERAISSATSPPCPKKCIACEGEDHHWMADCDEESDEPIWVCKHCEAQKPMNPDDPLDEW